MLALEVSVNGRRRYVAGHAGSQMLNVMISGNRELSAAGVSAFVAVPNGAEPDLETLSYEDIRLSVGDEVVVRVVDVETVDLPAKRNTRDGGVRIEASSDGS
jgi:protein involved in polysaccharide export with SLBB domain